MKRIMHIDLDAFFAACEEARRPELKGEPIIIGASPKGRGVVSTANYEARKYGVGSAMPVAWAYKRCPHGHFLPVDFQYYGAISERFFTFVDSLGFPFEQVSVDECYLDISRISMDGGERIAEEIKKWLYKKEKITCSIGIGPSKLIAKIGSDYKKPNGTTAVKKDEVESFLSPLRIEKIPGIGPKTKERLNSLGIEKISDLLAMSEGMLISKFGESRGRWLFKISRGTDNRSIGGFYVRKSIGAERTFMEDVGERETIHSKIDELIGKTYNKMRDKKFVSKTIVLKIRYQDFETHTVQKTSISTFSKPEEAIAVAKTLIMPFLKKNKKIRLVGARFTGLKNAK